MGKGCFSLFKFAFMGLLAVACTTVEAQIASVTLNANQQPYPAFGDLMDRAAQPMQSLLSMPPAESLQPSQRTNYHSLFTPNAITNRLFENQPHGIGGFATDSNFTHSPKKATLLALALPGAGQIYNRKYWKAPIVYAGLGGSIYAIGLFRNNMRTLNDSIGQLYRLGKTPSARLLEDRDNQRSRRDVAILCLTGVYVLQVLDAVVDAHFYKFNINDKIGLEWNASPSRMLAFQYQL